MGTGCGTRVILTHTGPTRAGFTAYIANCQENLCLPESPFSSHVQSISHPSQPPQRLLSSGRFWEQSQKAQQSCRFLEMPWDFAVIESRQQLSCSHTQPHPTPTGGVCVYTGVSLTDDKPVTKPENSTAPSDFPTWETWGFFQPWAGSLRGTEFRLRGDSCPKWVTGLNRQVWEWKGERGNSEWLLQDRSAGC